MGSQSSLGDVTHGSDPAVATRLYEESLVIIERLVESHPGNLGYQRETALSYGKLAEAARQSDPAKATHLYGEEHALFENLAQVDPVNLSYRPERS